MSDTERRARFIQWFAGPPLRGDRARLMRLTGLSKGRISQYLDDGQAFGERAAINLATRLGVDPRVFLIGEATAPSATAAATIPAGKQSPEAALLGHSLDQIADQERKRVAYAKCIALIARELPESWEPGEPL